jgi:hypothetical protein
LWRARRYPDHRQYRSSRPHLGLALEELALEEEEVEEGETFHRPMVASESTLRAACQSLLRLVDGRSLW